MVKIIYFLTPSKPIKGENYDRQPLNQLIKDEIADFAFCLSTINLFFNSLHHLTFCIANTKRPSPASEGLTLKNKKIKITGLLFFKVLKHFYFTSC